MDSNLALADWDEAAIRQATEFQERFFDSRVELPPRLS